eukprot:TRINITY_DN12636_c0_g1_i2.p1 TRINITY_DN12636_c0_g1~~TRINITY_DN12636_c0_g1_i2.p1  ORF type:complete len:123 (-),score=12.21 TRINITY_DN12636_c0_g1_i2:140-508(-)
MCQHPSLMLFSEKWRLELGRNLGDFFYWITFSMWIFLFKLEIFKCKLQLMMVPLLHACLVENPRVCGIRRAAHSVTEEREDFDRVEDHFECVKREGQYFLVNVLALSVPVGSKFSAITDLIG